MIFWEWRSYILLRVRRGLVRAGAWAAATAAAVSVSWFGVHRVLGDSSVTLPRALVVATAVPSARPAPPPPTSIGAPAQIPSPTLSPSPSPSPSGYRSAAPSTAPAAARTATGDGRVTSFVRPGGLIVVSMGASSAHLITATPDPGWTVQTWTGPGWLRVDFEQGGQDSIFYVTWNGHPPMVQT